MKTKLLTTCPICGTKLELCDVLIEEEQNLTYGFPCTNYSYWCDKGHNLYARSPGDTFYLTIMDNEQITELYNFEYNIHGDIISISNSAQELLSLEG